MSVDEIFQTMRDLVSEQFAMEPAEVTMDTSFEEDLGADSVDLVELVMAIWVRPTRTSWPDSRPWATR